MLKKYSDAIKSMVDNINKNKLELVTVFNEILKNSNHYWCWRSKSVVWPHLNKRGSVSSTGGYRDIYSYYIYGDMEYYTRIARGFNIRITKKCILGGICSKIYQQNPLERW